MGDASSDDLNRLDRHVLGVDSLDRGRNGEGSRLQHHGSFGFFVIMGVNGNVAIPSQRERRARCDLSGRDRNGRDVRSPRRDCNGRDVRSPRRDCNGRDVRWPRWDCNGRDVRWPRRDRNGRDVRWPRRERNGRDVRWPRRDRNGRDIRWPKRDHNGRDVHWPRRDRNGRDVRWPRVRHRFSQGEGRACRDRDPDFIELGHCLLELFHGGLERLALFKDPTCHDRQRRIGHLIGPVPHRGSRNRVNRGHRNRHRSFSFL